MAVRIAARSWASVAAGARAFRSRAYCAFASATAWRARFTESAFWATVSEYEARACDTCSRAWATASLAFARDVASPPALSIRSWARAAARLASATLRARVALVSSAVARTSPACTTSPTETVTDVTGQVTVSVAVSAAPDDVEAADVEAVEAVAADAVDAEAEVAAGRGRGRPELEVVDRGRDEGAAGRGRLGDGGRRRLRGAIGDGVSGRGSEPCDRDAGGADAHDEQAGCREGLELHWATLRGAGPSRGVDARRAGRRWTG